MATTSNSADIGIRVFLQDAASAALLSLDAKIGRLGITARGSSLLFGELTTRMLGLAAVSGLTLSFLGFGGALVYAVQQGMGLQQALTAIALATDLSTAALHALTPFLVNLGSNSVYSLQQLADGIAVVGQYGFKTTQQIKLLADAGVRLAEATSSKTTEAFKLLAVTMQAFNIPASQAEQTAELLFYSVEHGTPNIANLTSALGQLGGVSTDLHIHLQDLLPALDTVTVGMGSASTAAAGLRYFLTNIVHPTSAASAELKKLGISAFDAQGHFIGLKPLLQDISASVTDLSDKAKEDILGALFNIRSGTAIKQLLTQIKEYEKGVNEVSDAETRKSALDAAVARVMGQLSFVIHEVTSNFQDFAGFIGIVMIPQITQFLSKAINPILAKLRTWAEDPSSAQIVSDVLLIGTAISGVGLVIIGAFMSPIGAFLGVMALVMGAVFGAAVGIEYLRNHWSQIVPILEKVKGALGVLSLALLFVGGLILGLKVGSLINDFIDLIPKILAAAGAFLSSFAPAVAAALAKIAAFNAAALAMSAQELGRLILAVLQSAGAWLLAAGAEMLALAPYILLAAVIAGAIVGLVLLIHHLGFLNTILTLGRQIWSALLPAFQQAGAAIRGAFMDAIRQLQPVWQQLVAAFKQAEPALLILGKVLGLILVVAISLVIGIIRGLINVFVVLVTTAIHVVAGIIQAFAGVIQFFSGLFTFIHGLFTLNGAEIVAGLKTMGQGILNIFKGLWTAVSSVFTGAFNAIKGFVTGFIQGIIGFFQGLWDKLTRHSIIPDMLAQMLGMFLGVGPKVIQGVAGWIGGLLGHFKSLPGMILSALGNLGGLLLGAGQAIIQGFINGILSKLGAIKNAIGNLLGNIRNMFPHSPAKEGPLVDAHLWMPNLVHMLSDTAEKAGPSLRSSMGRVAGAARAGLGAPAGGSGGAGGGGGETYNLVVDGRVFMSFFHNQLTGQLQANGIGRVLK